MSGTEQTVSRVELRRTTHAGKLRALWHWLREEARRTRPVFIFFFTLLVLLIVKLTLAQYSIDVSAVSRALLGAVMAAKVVLIFENTPLSWLFRQLPRIVDIVLKSLLYGIGVILLGFLERIVECERHAASFLLGLQAAAHTLNLHRLLAVEMGVTIVFAGYFTFAEMNKVMGEGALREFFFKPGDGVTKL